jgi:ankyrin repeat protein
MADQLIRAGARVDASNRHGVTPLAIASLNGNDALIDRLLKAGADARRPGANGVTALMLAARNGKSEAIDVLLSAGVDVNAKESLRGTTALMWAVEQKHPEAVSRLIRGGADVTIQSGSAGMPRPYLGAPFGTPTGGAGDPRLPVATANQAQNNAAAETPIAGARGIGGGGFTALTFAARQGDIESARILLEEGKADPNHVTESGWSPLLVATQNRHYELGRFLISHGASVNLPNAHGWTPLYLATDNRNIEGGDYPVPKPDLDHLDYIKLLLANGADANARVAHGTWGSHTTLTRTIFTMQWFYEEGATPFVRAAQSGDVTLMKLLMSHGADPMIRTDWGDTALSTAAGIGWVGGVTRERSPEESLEAVRMLLDLGLDPNSVNQDWRTPLMGAAHKGRPEIIQLLVDRGARLETRDHGSRDTHIVDLSGHGGWQALDYADGLVRVGVQSEVPRPEASALLRKLMVQAGLEVPPLDRELGYVCAVQGELCKNPF